MTEVAWAFVGAVIGLVIGAVLTIWASERALKQQRTMWAREKVLEAYSNALYYLTKLRLSSITSAAKPNDADAAKDMRQHKSEAVRYLLLLSAYHSDQKSNAEEFATRASQLERADSAAIPDQCVYLSEVVRSAFHADHRVRLLN